MNHEESKFTENRKISGGCGAAVLGDVFNGLGRLLDAGRHWLAVCP